MKTVLLRRSTRAIAILALFALAPAVLADSGPAHRLTQTRPIALGTSGGNENDRNIFSCSSGTLGALVQKNGSQYILSNNHVLARTNRAAIGEDIIQPGLIDQSPVCGQDPADEVADLSQFVSIQFKKGSQVPLNTVDAAIAQVRPGAVQSDGAILDIGPVSMQVMTAYVGQPVKKSGRTTGLTTGTVTAINVTVDIRYANGSVARYRQQVTTTDMSDGGDSGSLIVTNDPLIAPPRPVGLLFAGSSTSTIANPINEVLNAFGVTMVGVVPASSLTTSTSTTATAQSSSTPPSAAGAARSRHEAELFSVPGVVGVGEGAGRTIEVYLSQENEQARRQIPPQLDGVPIRVVVTGEFHAQ